MLPIPVMIKITIEGMMANLNQLDEDRPYGIQNLGLFSKEQSADGACDQTYKDLYCKA